jgi:hypothetical protein
MTSQLVIIGTSPFNDVSIAVGPFRSTEKATEADNELTFRGWNTEICELMSVSEVNFVANPEE